MPLNDIQIAEAAGILYERRRAGSVGDRLPESCRPVDVQDALRIQDQAAGLFGHRVGAWKCGLPDGEKVVLAPIWSEMCGRDAVCPVRTRHGQVKVEPELAFVLGQDLPPREQPYADDEIDAAIARTHLALELIEQRFAEPSALRFPEKLADGLVNLGLLIGPAVDNDVARSTSAMAITVRAEGEVLATYEGRHPAAWPRQPLYWLVNYLRARGIALRAGQAVITGSYAGSWPVPARRDLRMAFGELGELAVRFEPVSDGEAA